MEVSIRLGMGVNSSHIVEGADVYMECSVLAASKVIEVIWRHEGTQIKGVTGDDGPSDALVTPRYLVIRGVTADHSGRYTCTANTADGEIVESVPLELRVRHAPRCGVRRDKVLAARPNEQLNVTCDVTADPDEGLHFFWIAEDDAGNRRHVTRAEAAQDAQSGERLPELRRSNQLEVLVDAHLFHATLLCWARNAVGTQRDPCRHRFELRREPASSLDCTIGNYTDTSFSITCASRQAWSRQERRGARSESDKDPLTNRAVRRGGGKPVGTRILGHHHRERQGPAIPHRSQTGYGIPGAGEDWRRKQMRSPLTSGPW
ncbi:hypothetical protein MTO96_012269 [Rhipicephalus appendiculatus]